MGYWFLGGGLLLLVIGSELAIRGGVALSRAAGVPPLLIGLVVLSAATSSPELAIALRATLGGQPDIALGTVVGSNILNLLLILGVAALIRPMPSPPKVVLRDGGTMLVASVVLALMAWDKMVSRSEGLILLAGFVAYAVIVSLVDWRRPPEHSVHCADALARLGGGETPSAATALFVLIGGLLCLGLGSHFAVGGAISFAAMFHLSPALVGLTILAFGAALPELALIVSASARGETSLAMGQLIGANIFNILAVLGLTATIHPLAVAPAIAAVDILVLVGAGALLLPMLASNWRLSRPQGALLVVSYAGYLAFLAWRQGLWTPHMLGLG
jgi:cation:H+ antiporter